MPQINVIKPFVYTRTPPKGLKVPVERWFKVGAGQEIDDEIAADPFISVRFADGCIENPEQAQERARIATEKAARTQREADEANLFAKQAYGRAVAAAQIGGKLRRDEPPASALAVNAGTASAAATGETTPGSTSGTDAGAESKAPATDAAPAPETAPAPTAGPAASPAAPSQAAGTAKATKPAKA